MGAYHGLRGLQDFSHERGVLTVAQGPWLRRILPPYPALDAMLHMLVEQESSVDDVVARHGFDRAAVARVERLLALAEYKRRQAPPGVKLGTRNFGRDRRYPITHRFRTG